MEIAAALNLDDLERDRLLSAANFVSIRAPVVPLLAPAQPDSDRMNLQLECLQSFSESIALAVTGAALRGAHVAYWQGPVSRLLYQALQVLRPGIFDEARSTLLLPSADGQRLEARYTWGAYAKPRTFATNAGSDGSFMHDLGGAGWAFLTQEPQLIQDTGSDPRFALSSGPPNFKSILCSPITLNEKCVGVLSFDFKAPTLTSVDRRLAQILAASFAPLVGSV